jgi:hypothetical protein
MPETELTRAAVSQESAAMPIALDTLAYARRLREVGFSEEQAEGQAQALAAAMNDTLATKQDLSELEARIETRFERVDARFEHMAARMDYLERHVDTRFAELEKRMETRFSETHTYFSAELGRGLADLERRMTLRLGEMIVAGFGVFSVLADVL